jgi:ribosome biogenesis protein YTM1
LHRYATGCYDGSARLWTPGGQLMCALTGHEGAVTTVSLLPPPSSSSFSGGSSGGCTVVAGGHDGTVRTWDVSVNAAGKASEGECRVFAGHEGPVNAVAASPGGAAFATVGLLHKLRIQLTRPLSLSLLCKLRRG